MIGYEAGRRCDTCGGESPRTPTCGECEVASRYEAKLEEAEARGKAAGYAEAVADVIRDAPALVRAIVIAAATLNDGMPNEEQEAWLVKVLRAHVGAAKKGGW